MSNIATFFKMRGFVEVSSESLLSSLEQYSSSSSTLRRFLFLESVARIPFMKSWTARLSTWLKHRTRDSGLLMCQMLLSWHFFSSSAVKVALFEAESVVTAKIWFFKVNIVISWNNFYFKLALCKMPNRCSTFSTKASHKFSPVCGPSRGERARPSSHCSQLSSIQWTVIPVYGYKRYFEVHTSVVKESLQLASYSRKSKQSCQIKITE